MILTRTKVIDFLEAKRRKFKLSLSHESRSVEIEGSD